MVNVQPVVIIVEAVLSQQLVLRQHQHAHLVWEQHNFIMVNVTLLVQQEQHQT